MKIKILAMIAVIGALAGAAFFALTHSKSHKYNIILVLTDDQNYRTWQHMPYLKSIAFEKGIIFKNAFATNPSCSPFRASLISGGFDSHETGVKANTRLNGQLHRLEETRTIATYLKAIGMKTGFVGKYMHGYWPGYVPPGWDRFVANERGGMLNDYWRLNRITYGSSGPFGAIGAIRNSSDPMRKYITDFQTEEALNFIDEFKNDRFFLFVSYYAPHVPHIPEKEGDAFYASTILFACNQEPDLRWRPGWVGIMARETYTNDGDVDECWEKNFRGQVALLQSVDRGIQRINNKLKEHDLLDKTVVIFSSDNGVLLGSKVFPPDKGMPYEDSIRVPLVAFIPGLQAHIKDDLIAANLDLGATIFDLAGVSAPTEGISLLDAINEKPLQRNRLAIENYGYLDWRRRRLGYPLPPIIWSGYRTTKWKYVEYTTGEKELYDILNDPSELNNLIGNPPFSDVVIGFHKDLKRERGLAITTISLPKARVKEGYNYKLSAWGGIKPYKWNASPRLPEGLDFDSRTGKISGVPNQPGNYKILFSVMDSGKGKHSLKSDHFSWEFSLEVCDEKVEC